MLTSAASSEDSLSRDFEAAVDLFDHRGVLLGDLVHLVYGRTDLRQSGRRFLARGRDVEDEVADLADLFEDPYQRIASPTDEVDAGFNLS